MTSKCPKCGVPVSDDAIYCQHCGHGLKPYSKTSYMQSAETLMVGAAIGFTVMLIISIIAIVNVYKWYPPFVVQEWFIYDQLFTAISFVGIIFGALAAALISKRKHSNGALVSATACTLSGASIFIISLIQPLAILWQSIVFFLLPLFTVPLVGTALTYWRKEELESNA